MSRSRELCNSLIVQIRTRIDETTDRKFVSYDDALAEVRKALEQFFADWPHRKSLLSFLIRSQRAILWRIQCEGNSELHDIYNVLETVQSAKLVDIQRSVKEFMRLPDEGMLGRVAEILVRFWLQAGRSSDWDFNQRHWLALFRIEPSRRIHSRYGAVFVKEGILFNIPALRRNMIARFQELVAPADPAERLREAIARLLEYQEPYTGLLVPSEHSQREAQVEGPPNFLFQTFERGMNEGARALFYALTLQMLDRPRTAGCPDFNEAFKVAEDILLTYDSFVRDSGFAGMIMGDDIFHYWRFWTIHDLLFTFGQHDAGATSYLTVHALYGMIPLDLTKAAFCNLVLHLPSFITIFSDLSTLKLNKTAYGRMVSEISEDDRHKLCQTFLLDDPGPISYDFCQKFLDWISGPIPKRDTYPPHHVRAPISLVPSLLAVDQDALTVNAHPLTANWFFERVYSAANFPAAEFGPRFEETVKGLIGRVGGGPVSGFFKYNGVVYEADCILDTQDCVLVLEMKTKPLTTKARTGNIDYLFKDFLNMFLKSQTQALRFWLALLKLEAVQIFKSEQDANRGTNPITTIVLNNRNVYTITVIPFGPDFLAQPVLTNHLIQTFSTKRITFDPTEPKLDRLQNDYNAVLVELVSTLEPNAPNALPIVMARSKLSTFTELYVWARAAHSFDSFLDVIKKTFHMQQYDFKSHSKILGAMRLSAQGKQPSDQTL